MQNLKRKISNIINKSEVSDKKEVPEMFSNDSGTSVDKDTTYSSVTDVVTDDRELAEPTAANDSVVQPRNNKPINRLENERTQNTTNSTDEKSPDAIDKPTIKISRGKKFQTKTLPDDAKPQLEDFKEASRYDNETSTRDSDDKSLDIINKSEVSDKKEVPEMFTNDSGTSVDKNTTYSSITDVEPHGNAHGTTSSMDVYVKDLKLNNSKSKVSRRKKVIDVITAANDYVVQPRNIELINRFENKRTLSDKNTANSTVRNAQLTHEVAKPPDSSVVEDSGFGSDTETTERIQEVEGPASQSLDLESEKNNVDRFCHGSEELSIDKATASHIQLVKYDKNQLYDNTEKDTGESNQLYEKEDLLNTKTTTITKITKQSIYKCDLDETITCIKKILKMINDNQHCTLEELEFRRSELKMEQLEEFLKETLVCEISKLSIGFTKHISSLIPSLCRIANKYKTSKLSLIFDDLKEEDIEALLENLDKNVEYEEVDMSYNRNIGSDGYTNVGKIVHEHKVRTLGLTDCNISDDDLHNLFDGMGDAKLEELDISCTDNLTAKGFRYIGKQVAQKRIKRLKLSDTQLNVETLTAFYREVVRSIKNSEGQDVLVEEIDVSYNSTMKLEAYKVLGSMVKLFGVKKLSLAGCGLRKKHLENFREKMNSENSIKETGQHTKMESLNAGDNTSIGKGIVEIAKIVNECELQELDMSECRFSVNELMDFIEALEEGVQLKCLYLGEKRRFDKNYISQVCNLLPHIKETLRLKGTVPNRPQSMLQEKLNILGKSKLEIKLDDDVTLCAQNLHN